MMTRESARLVFIGFGLLFAVLLMWLGGTQSAWSSCGDPVPESVWCPPEETVLSKHFQRTCVAIGPAYSPACAPEPIPFTTTRRKQPDDALVPLLKMAGSTSYPTRCEEGGPDLINVASGTLQINLCPSFYPAKNLCGGGWDRGIHFYGRGFQNTAAAALDVVYADHAEVLDIGAGIWLQGTSLGAAQASALAMAMDDEPLRKMITYVDMISGTTNLTSYAFTPGDLEAQAGYDIQNVYFPHAAREGRLDNQFWHRKNDAGDGSVIVDLVEAAEWCDAEKVKCKFVQHNCGHSYPCAKIPDGPWREKYNGPDEAHRLDLPVIVWTNSSANNVSRDPDGSGCYGCGTTYDAGNIIDSRDQISVPIAYMPLSAAGEMPAMPQNITVDYTVRPRRFSVESGVSYAWSFGEASGVVIAERDGQLTLPSIHLVGGDPYKRITLQRV